MNTKEKIAALKEVAEYIGGRFRTNYSGRGMLGASCVAISCDDDDECIEEAAARGIKGSRRDTLGKGYIVYWPDIESAGADTTSTSQEG